MTLQDHIADLIRQAAKKAQAKGKLPKFELPAVPISAPKRPGQGDFSSAYALQIIREVNEALKAQGADKLSPLQVAVILVEHMTPADFLGRVETAAPGFLNLFLDPRWLAAQAGRIAELGTDYFKVDMGRGERVQVEFVSANPTGPLHFGGARNAVIGDTLARVLAAVGYEVQREYYLNDRGTQVNTFAETLWRRYQQLFGVPVDIPSDGYPGAYVIDYARQIQTEYGDTPVEPRRGCCSDTIPRPGSGHCHRRTGRRPGHDAGVLR